jgi:hypothetical protein
MKVNDSILPISAITPELLSAWAQSERDKHAECVNGCKHRAESREISGMVNEAFSQSELMQKRVDKQIMLTITHITEKGDPMNSLRTFAVAMMEQGWELAAFALEGQKMDGMVS